MLLRLLTFAFVGLAVCSPAKGSGKGCRKNGQKPCGGTCFDLTSSHDHCGSCKNVCSASQACQSSSCVTPSCQYGTYQGSGFPTCLTYRCGAGVNGTPSSQTGTGQNVYNCGQQCGTGCVAVSFNKLDNSCTFYSTFDSQGADNPSLDAGLPATGC